MSDEQRCEVTEKMLVVQTEREKRGEYKKRKKGNRASSAVRH